MSGAREEILSRVREALRDVPGAERPEDVPVERAYRTVGDAAPGEVLARFEERLRDYGAEVQRVGAAEVGQAIESACIGLGLQEIVVAPAVPERWHPHGLRATADAGLSPRRLDELDGVLTGCAVAIAETGTIALDGGGLSGRRAITLVPDHHICVVRADQIVASVPEAIRRLDAAVREHHAPVTLVSGPSASSDIELSRVQGVHGPRHLLVLIEE